MPRTLRCLILLTAAIAAHAQEHARPYDIWASSWVVAPEYRYVYVELLYTNDTRRELVVRNPAGSPGVGDAEIFEGVRWPAVPGEGAVPINEERTSEFWSFVMDHYQSRYADIDQDEVQRIGFALEKKYGEFGRSVFSHYWIAFRLNEMAQERATLSRE